MKQPISPQWYTAVEAAEVLSRNSGHDVSESYPRKLAFYGLVRTHEVGRRTKLYYKPDIDNYVVGPRGSKGGRMGMTGEQLSKAKKRREKKPEPEKEGFAA